VRPALTVRPITLRAANAEVERLHRHHPAGRGCLFCLSVVDQDGAVRGVAIVGQAAITLAALVVAATGSQQVGYITLTARPRDYTLTAYERDYTLTAPERDYALTAEDR
jgi:hypothetical protein